MSDAIRRPVSQLRAGDLISLHEGGRAFVVTAVSQPLGSGRRVELVDAETGRPGPQVRLGMFEGVLTHPERARWVATPDGAVRLAADGTVLEAPAIDSWTVEIDPFGRPGWERIECHAQAPAESAA